MPSWHGFRSGCEVWLVPSGAVSAPISAGPGVVKIRTLAGSELDLPSGKPTVIYFFTASCGSCAAGAESVGAGIDKAASGIQAIAVDLDPGEPAATMTSFMKAVGNPPFTLARDDGSLLKAFNVDALGLTVILNDAGKEVYRGVDPSADRVVRALATARS